MAAMRDLAYLEFIRRRPCAFCGSGATEPHHSMKRLRGISEAGLGQKGSDYLAIPVCRRCHDRIHFGQLSPTREELLQLVVTYLIGYLTELRRSSGALA